MFKEKMKLQILIMWSDIVWCEEQELTAVEELGVVEIDEEEKVHNGQREIKEGVINRNDKIAIEVNNEVTMKKRCLMEFIRVRNVR